MTRRLPWLGLLALLALPACDEVAPLTDAGPRPDAGPRIDAGPPEDLDGYVTHHMATGGLPGLAAAVVLPGEIAWVGTYGYADVASETPVDAHTLFIMASISKTVAAVRALQLVEQGTLDLDANVEDYVGYAVRHPAHPETPITLRMLLTHTAGIDDDFSILAMATSNGDPEETLAEFAEGYVAPGGAHYAETNWGPTPGTRREYANAGYGVAGHVIEAAGGAPFDEQTRDAIFEPLDLDDAGWFLHDVDAARLATPHSFNGRGYLTLPQNGFAYYPASSWRVSVTGLARYAQALLSGGALDGERVLEEASVDELLRIQFPDISGGQALAFSTDRVRGNRYIGHSGATFGGSTQLLLAEDRGHALVLMTNSDAYVRSRLNITEGADAMERILERLDALARSLR